MDKPLEEKLSSDHYINLENMKLSVFSASKSEIMFDNKFSPQLHFHIYYEIFFVNFGSITIKFQDGDVVVGENDLLIVSPKVAHCAVSHADKTTSSSFYFSIAKNTVKASHDLYDKACDVLCTDYLLISDVPKLKQITKNICEAIHQKDSYYLGLKFHEFFVELIYLHQNKSASTDIPVRTDSDMSRFYKIDAILTKRFTEDICLDEIADALFLSKKQTGRIISKHYGVNFRTLIVQMRMKKSAELLSQTDDPVSLVASKMGYSSLKGFYYIFKKYYGVLPTEYRAQNQKQK